MLDFFIVGRMVIMLLTILKYLGIGAVIVIVGFIIGFYYRKAIVDNKLNSAESTCKTNSG